MNRRAFLYGSVLILAAPLAAEAQPGKVHRIGYLSSGPSTSNLYRDAFQQSLRELGWVEGQNIVTDYRFAEGHLDRLPDLAVELVRLRVDVIVASPTPAAMAAKNATGTIPIVMWGVGDPVGLGLVASLARPGGNVTGVSYSVGVDTFGKGLELLREAIPNVRRVAVLSNPANPAHALYQRARLANLAAKNQLPSMQGNREYAEAGGLMSYGPSNPDALRRAASFVDKILKGANPADLPVEQPTKFELVINLKTAKALGLTIPPSLLLRADQVIE